jgi:hypothetical protein
MPRYIIEREMGECDVDALGDVARKSKDVADGMEGVVWIRSYISEPRENIYCEYEAPNPEAVYAPPAREVGLPVTKLSEVAMEVDPSMFH